MSSERLMEQEVDQGDFILPHSTYNDSGGATILFVHGAFQSRREWNLVIENLPKEYHLLVPDLPGHGESRYIMPFSTRYAAKLIAELIQKCAHNRRSHVIGLSLGAHVAIELATLYPDLIEDIFISGFEIYEPNFLSPCAPYIIWVVQRLENTVPRVVIRWLMDGADLETVEPSICTLPLCQEIVETMIKSSWPLPWRARTLIVAAGKRGLVPSRDHPEDAKRLSKIGNDLNNSTTSVSHPAMRHPWNRQAPKLFAQTALAWFERRELPSGFK